MTNPHLTIVRAADPGLYKQWLLERHYAHTIPIISHAFVLLHQREVAGACTFGPPPRMFNDGYGLFAGQLEAPTFELNRLVIGDSLPPHSLSWFVAAALKTFDFAAIVSYADTNHGHHGYIYQATNWLYVGTTNDVVRYVNTSGRAVHARTIVSQHGSRAHDSLPEYITVEEQTGKHRYLYLRGSKAQRRAMRLHLAYSVLPYPKGDNRRYDTPTVASQTALF